MNVLSVIVCTYNRAESLKDTLDSLSALRCPLGWKCEFIVVDNNSTDATADVVNKAKVCLPELQYVFEEKQGLSYARNHGIEASSGQILVFTDDDVCPEPDWLIAIVSGMDETKCVACGGYVAPVWEESPPIWLTEKFYGFLAIKVDSDGPKQLHASSDLPFGANMAFRRSIFDRYGHFDVTRGRKGNNLASGEDGELFSRIIEDGGLVFYFPEARVHHKVESFRLRKSYFRRWRYQASSNIALSCGVEGSRRIFGVPIYLFGQTLRAVVKAIKSRLTQAPDEAFYQEIIVWHFFGFIKGLYLSRK